MPDRTSTQQTTRPPRTTVHASPHGGLATYLRRFHEQSPPSTQLIGLMTLVISGGVLLLLTGVTLTALVLGFVFFSPIIILSSPLWVPVAAVGFAVVAGFLLFCGFGVAAVAALSWVYRYYKGLHPVGSDRVDYARSRIATTAREVKDYAREYGGYLHIKVKDAAPGA